MSTIKKRRISTADLCYIGVMSAISVVLSLTLKIPMAFLAPWLKLDLSFVPVMLTGFALEGESYQALARRTGLTLGQVKIRLHRIRRRLRDKERERE